MSLETIQLRMKIIGVDVGGTFTDIIMIDSEEGRWMVHKVPSTPESQDIAVIQGIEELVKASNIKSEGIELVVHGTTVATNAMLERKGANVCLITTAGLEDVLEIGRQNRDDIYSLRAIRPEPLVTQHNRIGVKERIDWAGNVLLSLTQSEIDRIVGLVKERDPTAIAISLLFSFRMPEHEMHLLDHLRDSTDSYVVASSEILPEFREYERTSTTVLEAYLGPLVLDYLDRLDSSLNAVFPNAKLTLMQSNGGTMLCSRAYGHVTNLAISGLAGGVIGGWETACQSGINRAITLDMGGTSCDISAIQGNIVVHPDNEVGGLPVRIPSVDVKTIGAGGGSIAWVDEAGVLHVGPQSAGANPGPAAYDKGGEYPTITDANLILGRLNPDYFLGGRLQLNMKRAKEAVSEIAKMIGKNFEQTALGIVRISTANMVQAIREVTVERGSDPRNFVLIPFGGAGPTQAADIANSLGIDSILIPPHPGITSALGLVCSDLRVDLMKTVLVPVSIDTANEACQALRKLDVEGRKRIAEQGAPIARISTKWEIDMRYAGQSHELPVPIPQEFTDFASQSRELFERLHENNYGYRLPEREVEWVTTRVVATAKQDALIPYRHENWDQSEPVSQRFVLLDDGSSVRADVYRRNSLGVGQSVVGPAIIEQPDTTIYLSPEWNGEQRKDGIFSMRRLYS